MTASKLIEILSKVDGNTKVKCTWEGMHSDIHGIYIEDGTLYIDSDTCFYAPDELLYKDKHIIRGENRWTYDWEYEEDSKE